ncbi:MAG TPA: DUF2017 family protein [Actinomycetota bacterium]|jgi:hypothetical protein|nr:DUF2017 family protein [Actinomycetota bacterium]
MEIRLTRDEAELLRELCKEMRTLLEADIPRVDPVVARLFPDAYEEEDDTRAYRELVGDDLRMHKLGALRRVEEGLGGGGATDLVLEGPAVDSWLTFLTDARLAIGTRLDVTEETMDTEREEDDPDAPAYSVLHYLGWLQEITIRGLEDEA